MRATDLERKLSLRQYQVSRLVEGLVDSGCVVRHCPTIDNRSHLIRLTERGRDLQQRMAYALGVDAEIIAQFSDEDADLLGRSFEPLLRYRGRFRRREGCMRRRNSIL
jgi:DNA-binding MarR family transcriptional regulator